MLCFQRSKTKIRVLVSINGILIKSNLTFEQVNPTPKWSKQLDPACSWINIHSQVDFYHLCTNLIVKAVKWQQLSCDTWVSDISTIHIKG